MQQIADLHIHSKYSRACSRDLVLEKIDQTCRIKGVDIIATGDFTFPAWFKDIKNCLTPSPSPKQGEGGLFILKTAKDDKIKFLLSTELALIYKKGDRVRRIHIVVHAPNIAAVEELNNFLGNKYNIKSDGRPILGMRAEDLIKLCLSIHPQFLIYPAHIWTPWFSVFGSKSGFNSMEECFGEFTKDVYAYETGLSSDPEMNWRLSALDKLTLLSNSDAHSLPNIGREANVFDLEEITYDEIYQAIKTKDLKKIKYTIEFYPEEGMYHYDGHRDCHLRLSPAETKKYKGICPVCKKPITIGVMYRVEELA
ncbi:MAG: endonuclease Q family protein, partial [Candidatus Falkowbacteria bacterium]|nr:endonuclease Q family protein [Candidatus Falkowbacteria bacterium]